MTAAMNELPRVRLWTVLGRLGLDIDYQLCFRTSRRLASKRFGPDSGEPDNSHLTDESLMDVLDSLSGQVMLWPLDAPGY